MLIKGVDDETVPVTKYALTYGQWKIHLFLTCISMYNVICVLIMLQNANGRHKRR